MSQLKHLLRPTSWQSGDDERFSSEIDHYWWEKEGRPLVVSRDCHDEADDDRFCYCGSLIFSMTFAGEFGRAYPSKLLRSRMKLKK